MRVDALVNCGNALATLAEVENPSNSLAALEKAAAAYQDALAREEDALVRAGTSKYRLLQHC